LTVVLAMASVATALNYQSYVISTEATRSCHQPILFNGT
jgi:hypothetical protein